ncbi:MAG TPA: FHA domain-containing protein, partial [Feifaniaceae bacterium]|nr:FHA domain-containing protein [Feifaniaceae bacterium]
PAPEPTPLPTTPEPPPIPTLFGLPVLWVVGGGVLLIALAVILTLAAKRRKKKRSEFAGAQEQPGDTAQFSDFDMDTAAPLEAGHTVPLQQQPDIGRIALRFTRVGPNESRVYRAELGSSLMIGRKAGQAALSFPEDNMLSGKHCEIIRRGESLFINDLGSTNKTYVNGVMTAGYHKLEQDDVIYIGSMELRVNWD